MIILKGEVEQRKFKNGCLQPRHACGRSAPLATISAEMRKMNKKHDMIIINMIMTTLKIRVCS